jgi:NDP-sugar pyrophosphorylase family protein
MKVVIPTSGLGSRLGELTKHTSKSLVPLGSQLVIDFIIAAYDRFDDVDYVVLLGHQGDLVQQYLKLAYPERSITFLWVDNYCGDGSSMLRSLCTAASRVNEPFYLHCCDTIIDSY